MKYKNLLILGASGMVGQLLVKIAIELGYNVTVVVRSKGSMEKFGNIKIIQGSVLDDDILERAIEGQDAVMSCLGIKRKNQSNPWSPLASPVDFTESVTKKALPIMKNYGIQRLVAISSAGVGDSWNILAPFLKLLIRSSNVKYALHDFDKMEKLLLNSEIDSLTVRPVALVDEESSSPAKISNRFKMSSKISRREVAKWMIDALRRKEPFENPTEMIG